MKSASVFLISGPLVMAALLLIGWNYFSTPTIGGTVLDLKAILRPKSSTDDDCASCSKKDSADTCSVEGDYVLGGVDIVQYFTDFKLPDGTYNESQVPSVGLDTLTSSYGNFQFKFISVEHKELFDANPTYYIPQFGGFCGWGISAEFCPSYPWAEDCIGPPGDVTHWTIVDEKLYLFFFDSVKTSFLEDVDNYIVAGTERWESWFGDTLKLNTGCVYGVSR